MMSEFQVKPIFLSGIFRGFAQEIIIVYLARNIVIVLENQYQPLVTQKFTINQ